MKLSAQVASLSSFLAVVLLSTANGREIDLESSRLRQRAIVDLVNTDESSTWKATPYPQFEAFSRKDFERLCGTLQPDLEEWKQTPLLKEPEPNTNLKDIPDTFDARSVWPYCQTIKEVMDQGRCGACWAFSTVEVLQDRFCIASNGDFQPRLAPNDPLACCGKSCTDIYDGCTGGSTLEANKYYVSSGVVTQGCSPYFLSKQCKLSCYGNYPTCTQSCANGASWLESKWYSSRAYIVAKRTFTAETDIQRDVVENGPVTVQFKVYEDLYNYKSGVYQYSYGEFTGWHSVKLLGWGTEDGVPYWLLANSWGSQWGLSGFFKMRRGSNECRIESSPVAALPKIPSTLPRMVS